MQFQTIKKEMLVKQAPKHESCIAKIFNYNPSQKGMVVKKNLFQTEQTQCNQVSYFLITKTLESMKLQESIAIKQQGINEQTKKKNDSNNRMIFKLELDQKTTLQTQRKSQDALNVEKKTNNFAIIQNMFDLETKNLEMYMQAQEKRTQIQQLQSELEQQNIKQEQQIRQQNQERDELLQKIQQLEYQCEQQKIYIEQIPLMQTEAQEWKDRFLNLNKQFHQSQEMLFRIEAEQQSSQRRTLNYKI